MEVVETMDQYRVPNWLGVSPLQDGVQITDRLTGRKFVVRGIASRALLYIRARHAEELSELEACEDGHLRLALESLKARGFVVDGSSGSVDYPRFISTGAPLLGAGQQLSEIRPGDIVFFGAPSNFGNRTLKGVIGAPDALRALSSMYALRPSMISPDNMDRVLGLAQHAECETEGTMRDAQAYRNIHDAGNVLADISLSSGFVLDRIKDAAGSILRSQAIPFMIGGDHATTLGALRAVSETYATFDVIHIDAHTDTYARPIDHLMGGALGPGHGNFMRVALEEIPQIGRVHQWGIRGLGNLTQREHDKQTIHWIGETRRLAASRGALRLSDNPVYLTVDIDALDPGVAPGTGSPLPNGLTFSELATFLHNVLAGNNVVGIDLVELDVEQDVKEQTKVVALEAIAFIVACLRRPVT